MSRSRHSEVRVLWRRLWRDAPWGEPGALRIPLDLWLRLGGWAPKRFRKDLTSENRAARRQLLGRALKAVNQTGEADHSATEPRTAKELEKKGRRWWT